MNGDERKPDSLMSGSRIARGAIWNVLGQVLPLMVGLITIPYLIDQLGVARFGVLSIAWMVIGYFSIFDFGIGRALTKITAEKLGCGQHDEIPPLIWTALLLMAVLGLFGGVVILVASDTLVKTVLEIPDNLITETLNTFYLLALSVPLVILTTGLRGVLEAYQRFGMVNLLRVPLGIWTFVGPVAALAFSSSLPYVVFMLLLGRGVALLAHLVLCFYVVPSLKSDARIKKQLMTPLAKFGGWMTVSNIVGPIMVYMDRFFIGALISMAAVAYYATPYEVVTKLWILPMGLVGVLFPVFSSVFKVDKQASVELLDSGTKYIFISMFPLILAILLFSFEGLNIWLGDEFALEGAIALKWLAIGVFFNSIARVPFAMVQGAGRPDIIAIIHLIELPLYLAVLYWSLDVYGIAGAAASWTLRILLDYIVMFLVVSRLLPESKKVININHSYMVLATVVFLFAFLANSVWQLKLLAWMVIVSMFAAFAWKILLKDKDRIYIKGLVKKMRYSGC